MNILTGHEAELAKELNFLVKTYEGINKLVVATKLRLGHLNPEAEAKHDTVLAGEDGGAKGLESVKGTCSRRIANCLKNYPIWTEWAVNVPGCGPAIAGTLVCEWTYKMLPICADCSGLLTRDNGLHCELCGKEAKGDGVLKYRIETRDYPNISKWWAKLGRHVVDGKMPKRAKGEVANWSTRGRTITKMLGECFVKSPATNPYRAYYDERKAYRVKTHPESSKGHRHNMAMNETVKLFLSHWWQVARTLEGKPLTDPYPIQIMGHTGIIPPYYWPKGH